MGRWGVRAFLIASLLGLSACGTDVPGDAAVPGGGEPRDSAVGVDGGLPPAPGVTPPAPPAAPEVPRIGPCPEGWTEATDEGVPVCLPLADTGPSACVGATFRPPGEESCVSIGTPCPAGDFPDTVAGTSVFYVRPGAVGGDGSRARPWAALDDVEGVPPGGVIILSKGMHAGQFQVPPGATLRGTCTAETILTRPGTAGLLLAVGGADTTLADLTIADVPGVAVVAYGGGGLTVERVLIERSRQAALRARTGSTLVARDVSIREVLGKPLTDVNGFGAAAEDGSEMSLTRVVIDQARQAGILSTGEGTRVDLDRVAVLRTLGQESDGSQGMGLAALAGATIEARETVVTEARFAGLYAGGASLSCDRCYVARTLPEVLSGAFGEGTLSTMNASVPGSLTLRRTLIDEPQTRGVRVESGSSTTLDDVVVRDVVPESGGEQGRGLHAFDGGSLTARRVALLRTVGHAISATSGSRYDVEDVIIRGVQPRALDGVFGRALSAVDGAVARAVRVSVEGHSDMAVMVSTTAQMTIEDLDVGPVIIDGDLRGGVVQVQDGATASISRVTARGWRFNAVVCVLNATCSLADAAFVGGGDRGEARVFGIATARGSTLEADRVRLAGVTSLGVHVQTEAAATYRDLDVRDVTACDDRCSYPGGTGLLAMGNSSLTVDRFSVADASLCGAHLFEGGEADLSNGVVSGSQIGVCLETTDYAIDRIAGTVVFLDNQTNLDAIALPTPPSPPTFGGEVAD